MKINVEYVEVILGELDKYFKKKKRTHIILDDLIVEASKSLKVTQLFTCGCHGNISEIILHKICSIKINDYMIIFKNPQDKSKSATIV